MDVRSRVSMQMSCTHPSHSHPPANHSEYFHLYTHKHSSSTPLDVIKTRMQATPPPGVAPYKGWVPTVTRIVSEEGAGALFKGVGPRTIIISPLFGIALMVKETLANFFPS